MNLEEIKAFLDSNKEQEEVQEYLKGFTVEIEKDLTLEGVQKGFEEKEDLRKWLESEKDRHYSKGLETWKSKTLPSLIDEEITKRNPGQDPKDLEIEKIRKELEEQKRERFTDKMILKLKDQAAEQGLPINLIHLFVGNNEEETTQNFEKFKGEWDRSLKNEIDKIYKQNGSNPGQSDPGTQTKSFKDMSLKEKNELFISNRSLYDQLANA